MTSPTQRSLKLLRSSYPLVRVTEHWNQFARVRQDLFGFVDIIAVDADTVLAVQTTSGDNVTKRMDKLQSMDEVRLWLQSPSRKLEVHGWRKLKGRWRCRVVVGWLHQGQVVCWAEDERGHE